MAEILRDAEKALHDIRILFAELGEELIEGKLLSEKFLSQVEILVRDYEARLHDTSC